MSLWKSKALAFVTHLTVSIALAGLAAWLVFGVWYPHPYETLSDGEKLFLMVVGTDVIVGPLITLVIFNSLKSRREKWIDFSVVGIIQLLALVYGLWSVYAARPVHLVFEYDRFRVVHAPEIPTNLLEQAPAGIEPFPKHGPTLLGLRPFPRDRALELTTAAVGGVQYATRPDLWQPYNATRAAVKKAMHPATELLSRFPDKTDVLYKAASESGKSLENIGYLPVLGRKLLVWTILLDADNANIIGFIPIDSF